MFVDVSARNGTNIDELLEAVTLTADVLERDREPTPATIASPTCRVPD